MKRNRTFLLLFASVFAAVFVMAPSAFADGWLEGEFDQFGPRADQIRFNFFDGPDAEFTALENHLIDITDLQLNMSLIEKWSDPPYNETIEIDWYGPQRAIFHLDFNHNETLPNGSYNPLGDPTIINMTIESPGIPDEGETYIAGRGYHLKHAIAHLLKREEIIITALEGLGEAVYTWLPSFYGSQILGSQESLAAGFEPADQHPYSPIEAEEILTKADFVDTDTPADGIRNDPVTGNNLDLKFYYRFQHSPGRKELGEILDVELTNVGIGHHMIPVDGAGAFTYVLVGRDFHLYTGGWNLGLVPNHLFVLWSAPEYWCFFNLDYGNYDDPVYDYWAERMYYAPDEERALYGTWKCQELLMDPEHMGSLSVWSTVEPRAHHVAYTDASGEHPELKGKPWTGVVNELGFGLYERIGTNGYLTFLNMHPEGVETGGTIEYGIHRSGIPGALNPFYASWYTDYQVIDKCYDSLLRYNPYHPAEPSRYMPWLAKFWTIGNWSTPYGNCTKLTFWLRDDVYWHDGTPFTSADVSFTIEYGEHYDADWSPLDYCDIYYEIDHVETPDDYTVIVYLDRLNYWAINWISLHIPIAPKHIWEPIFATDNWDIFTGFSPDPSLIGTGPFKVYPHSIDPADADYYVPDEFLLLDKNIDFFLSAENAVYTMTVEPIAASLDIYIWGPDGDVWVFIRDDLGNVENSIVMDIRVRGGWGYTTIPGTMDGVTYDFQIFLSTGNSQSALIAAPITGSTVPGDLTGGTSTSTLPPRDPPNYNVDYRDLFWFLKAYGQTALTA